LSGEDRDWQRADKWLWCARFLKHRADCVRLVSEGGLRINRQPTDKPHARLRVGDVLTLALGREVRVIVVEAFAERRGPAQEARGLYRDIPEGAEAGGCGGAHSAAYPGSAQTAARSA
jgi:ribosome-associated heat shock protein Hsp15